MTNIIPTQEQLNIIDFAQNDSRNLIINAYAGAAKTSTLVMATKKLDKQPILMLAFNKSTATEMQAKVSSMVVCKTLNALGHKAWREELNIPRLIVSSGKNYKNVKNLIEQQSPASQTKLYPSMADIIRTVAFGKSCGYIPDRFLHEHPNLLVQPLMDDVDFEAHLETILSPLEWNIVEQASSLSLKQAYEGYIDFDDQILMPTVFPATFPQYPIVMIDEAQDLSSINHAMLLKVAKEKLIAVGDRCQAIYGFRGAHMNSMDFLQDKFNMHALNLTASFRCPLAVIKTVQNHARNMVGYKNSVEGSVKELLTWGADDLDSNTVIICRNNAPLFTIAIKLLKAGKSPKIHGRDIALALKKIMEKFGNKSMLKKDVHYCIDGWEEKMRKKTRTRGHGKIMDQADCLRLFADETTTLGGAIEYISHVLDSEGSIQLMTGHASKGKEFSNVFYLDPFLLNMEDGQDKNLNYVIRTRAQDKLRIVMSLGFVE